MAGRVEHTPIASEPTPKLKSNVTISKQIIDLVHASGPEGVTVNVRVVSYSDCF